MGIKQNNCPEFH